MLVGEQVLRRMRLAGAVAGATAAIAGAWALAGWAGALGPVAPDLHRWAMQPLTAVAVVVAGVAIMLQRGVDGGRRIRWIAWVPLLIGVVELAEVLTRTDGTLTHLLVGTTLPPGSHLPSGLALFATGLALAVSGGTIAIWAPLVPLAIGLVSVGGYFDVSFAGVPGHPVIPISAAVAHTLIGFGLLLVTPDRGLVRQLLGRSSASVVARRVFVLTWVVPLAVGAALLWAFQERYLDPAGLAGLLVVLMVLAMSAAAAVVIRSLDRTERRLQALFDGVPVGLYRSLPDGTVLDANPKLAEILGTDVRTVRTMNAVHWYASSEGRERFLRTVREQPPGTSIEVAMRTAGGEERWVEMRAREVRGDDGSLLFIEGSMVDVTDRQRLADRLVSAERLEASGQLAGSLAHDFNNLLTVVHGNASLVLHALDPDDPRQHDLEQVIAATNRAAHLTRQLLAFSRNQLFEMRALDVNEVIEGMRPLLASAAGEVVTLHLDLMGDLGTVRADPSGLEQVVTNLVVNARDAMPPTGGQISIRTANVRLNRAHAAENAGAVAGPHVLLTVTDTGSGIPPDVMPRIFEPFFTTKEPGRGTGLGLAGAYGIVRQSGGHIVVESELGRGTTFKVYLPQVDGAPERRRASGGRPVPAQHAETVLLVDDNEPVRRTMCRMLEHLGYRVLSAEGYASALALVDGHGNGLKLLLTDVVMPGRSGPELAEDVRARCPGIRVLFTTGYAEGAVLREGPVDPGVAVLQKPVTLEGLAAKVREVLDRPS